MKDFIIIFLFISGLAGISSCRDDLSSLDLNKIDGAVVDTTEMSSFSVYQFEHLVVKPKLSLASRQEADFSYEWKMNLSPSSTVYEVLGREKNLDAEIRFRPYTTGDYQLVYTVTDKNNGLNYITVWPLTVKNSIGEGLVVAETTDGQQSDLSHIMSPRVTPDYTSESIKRHVYSAVNGRLIPGVVKQLSYDYEASALFGITDNSIVRVNTLDYTAAGSNDDLFHAGRGTYSPVAIDRINQSNIYIENGRLTATYIATTKKFGIAYDYAFSVPKQIALSKVPSPVVAINFYDEGKGYFVYQPSVYSFGDNKMHAIPAATGKAFNAGNLPGKQNLAAGTGVDGEFLHVLKDKATANVSLYVLDKGSSTGSTTLPPEPKSVFDLTNAPDIANATRFVFMENQRVLYYATRNKIYAVLYGTSVATFAERYTAPAGEEITTLQVYQQGDYPFRDKVYSASNNTQLIMSTYSTEGKVYILPLINVGLGNIDQANIKSFGGFGRITAIIPQK